jgi:hypothetical protein
MKAEALACPRAFLLVPPPPLLLLLILLLMMMMMIMMQMLLPSRLVAARVCVGRGNGEAPSS